MNAKQQPKLIISIYSPKGTNSIYTDCVHDTRTNSEWTPERITARGITNFNNMKDLKETLNWNLNGNQQQYEFKWQMHTTDKSYGIAKIYD